MISFVTWKWQPPAGSARSFGAEHVNILRGMIARHYPEPHKLLCLTDDTNGLDKRIEALPMPDTKLEHLLSPMRPRRKPRGVRGSREWRHRRRVIRPSSEPVSPVLPAVEHHFPACYRRLWLFSDAACSLGERIVLLDVDVVIVSSLLPLVQQDADFIGWTAPRFGWHKIAGGAWLLRTGTHTQVWTQFDANTSPQVAFEAGFHGSDQAWLSYMLYPPKATWTPTDGLLKINWTPAGAAAPPPHARMLFTAGNRPPWHGPTRMQYPWLKEHYRA